ncbi:AraC-like DNA-binding protein [Agromyces hippuratus]|uniref:AraC-like DNA-binding protein n=1 Tax=Agromyces hippuratus TaxID=286438 RepID=A0A852WWT2_9MICO|nr:helix-turn-helix domain-containing protein [Agromyces hippuratus]NYG20710.1 AraC-like DNA-binding protein [Agromyces hippuratus]
MQTGENYWRSRAGAAVKGVLAGRPGEPGIAPLAGRAAEQADSIEAPVRLTRHAVSADLEGLARHIWIPRWRLPSGIVVEQGVLDYPSANLVVEPHAAALYGPELGRSRQRLEGEGWAFGVLLQPGVAHRLAPGPVREIVGSSVPLDALRATDAAGFAEHVRAAVGAGDEASAIAGFEAWLRTQRIELDDDAALLRQVVELAETDRTIVRAESLAAAAGLSLRALERLVRGRLGLTPKWLIGRYRMQEASQALAAAEPPSLAELAADLGFSDQAHFTRQFRAVIGETPRRYALAAAATASETAESSTAAVPSG